MYIKSNTTEYSPQERDQITVLYFKTADRLHLDYNKMLQEAEQHSNNDSVEELKLYFDNMFADYIAQTLAVYDYYTSKELTPRISEKLIQLNDFKKFNDEITPLDDEQEKPVKTRKITGKAINIADCPYLTIVDIDIDKKISEEERNLIRNELQKKIYQSELNVGLVKTAHGGLHIYCNRNCYRLPSNHNVKVGVTDSFDIDIFAQLNKQKIENGLETKEIVQNRVVIINTSIRETKNNQRVTLKHEAINEWENESIQRAYERYLTNGIQILRCHIKITHSNNDSVEELKLYFDNMFADILLNLRIFPIPSALIDSLLIPYNPQNILRRDISILIGQGQL
ncbi:MAG: hypothetical protein EZS28_040917, partial [Streblomastix strix]